VEIGYFYTNISNNICQLFLNTYVVVIPNVFDSGKALIEACSTITVILSPFDYAQGRLESKDILWIYTISLDCTRRWVHLLVPLRMTWVVSVIKI